MYAAGSAHYIECVRQANGGLPALESSLVRVRVKLRLKLRLRLRLRLWG